MPTHEEGDRTFDRPYGFALELLLGGDVESGVCDGCAMIRA